jgi:hypothetical protein
MRAPTDNAPPSRSVLMRFLVRSWEYRRPRLWIGVRFACGIFNVVLGVLLLASVSRLGSLTGAPASYDHWPPDRRPPGAAKAAQYKPAWRSR